MKCLPVMSTVSPIPCQGCAGNLIAFYIWEPIFKTHLVMSLVCEKEMLTQGGRSIEAVAITKHYDKSIYTRNLEPAQ